MEEQYRIFDQDGVWIDQLSTSVERAYGITTETSAKLALSVFDRKCHPYTINFGNSLLCENSDGLIPWAGMIDDIGFDKGYSFSWAYTPERWFLYRRGPRRLTLKGTAGEIFAQLIQQVNQIENTPIRVGNIASNSGAMEETLNPVSLIENLRRIVQRSGECYRWRPEVSNGRLTIFADWFPSTVLSTGLILQDGFNITSDHPMTMNPPRNDYLSYGEGTDWATRIISEAVDHLSIQRYGRRQASNSVRTKAQVSLDRANQVSLAQFKDPQYSFPISALNVGDTFKNLMPGALATFTQLVGQGFSSDGLGYLSYDRVVKVMNFDPNTQRVGLAI
jgi:hypothetical protein